MYAARGRQSHYEVGEMGPTCELMTKTVRANWEAETRYQYSVQEMISLPEGLVLQFTARSCTVMPAENQVPAPAL